MFDRASITNPWTLNMLYIDLYFFFSAISLCEKHLDIEDALPLFRMQMELGEMESFPGFKNNSWFF